MEWFWSLYWVCALLSLPGSVAMLVKVATPSGKWSHLDAADWFLLSIAAISFAPFWVFPAGYWGYQGVRAIPSLYPNARRERKRELMERRRKERFEAGLRTLEQIERDGRRELERKQAKNRREHAEFQRELDPPKPKPMREVNTSQSGIRMSRETDKAIRDAKRMVDAIVEKRNRGQRVYEKELLAAEAAVNYSEAMQFANDRRMAEEESNRATKGRGQVQIDGFDSIVEEDTDGEILNWNQLHPELRQICIDHDLVRRIGGKKVSAHQKLTLVYRKDKLGKDGLPD